VVLLKIQNILLDFYNILFYYQNSKQEKQELWCEAIKSQGEQTDSLDYEIN